MTRERILRISEFCLIPFLIFEIVGKSRAAQHPGSYIIGGMESWRYEKLTVLDHCRRDWFELLLLAAWVTAPILLRPLTTPKASPEQRYALGGLIIAAGLTWLELIERTTTVKASPSIMYDYEIAINPRNPFGFLLFFSLLAFAGYLRVRWSKGGCDHSVPGATG